MSLKEIVEPIYNQIMNQNILAENKMIRALDETLFASNSGTNTLGAAGHIIKPKLHLLLIHVILELGLEQ